MSGNWVSFPTYNITFNINPIAFTVFGLSIYWYGIIIAVGMLIAMIYCFKRMEKFGISSDRAVDVVIGGVIGGVLGARAYYIAFFDGITFSEFFNTRSGGLAIYGGVIGALLVGAIMCKIRKVKILPMFDITSIGFTIGQAIGRWGNFINQEAFGSQTDLPWGMTGNIIQSELNVGSADSSLLTVHPCFLYESIWCLLGFFILHFISKRRKFDGQVFLTYLAWYGIGRFFIEGLRTDSLMLGRLRVSQVLAGLLVIVSLIFIFAKLGKIKRSGVPAVLYAETDESKTLIASDYEKATSKNNKKDLKSDEENSTNDADDSSEKTEDTEDGKDN